MGSIYGPNIVAVLPSAMVMLCEHIALNTSHPSTGIPTILRGRATVTIRITKVDIS
jgi:hypothetical protein